MGKGAIALSFLSLFFFDFLAFLDFKEFLAFLSAFPSFAGIVIWNENSAQSFSDRSFWKSLRVVDVRAFGSWMSAAACFSRILTTLTEVLGRDIRANDPQMSAGCPSLADFSFLM